MQVRVERGLDPRLADVVDGLDALARHRLQLLLGDRPDDAEELRGEIAVRVAPDVGLGKADAGELARALLQVDHERRRRLRADDDGVEQVVRLLPLADKTQDRANPNVREGGELHELVVAPLACFRELGGVDGDGGDGCARHERVSVLVDDRPALGAHRDEALLVRRRARGVFRAGENLQRPQPHHERRKTDEEQRAEDRKSPRELRRHAVRLDRRLALGLRSRLPARASRGGASQGAAPPR